MMGSLPEPDWRSFAMTKLQRYGFKVLNPLELAWTAPEFESEQDRRIRRALDLINQCDAVLANVAKGSYGTAMEIFYAHRQGKTVTVIGHSPFSPWVLSHSQARFTDVDAALEYLIGEQPQLDPVRWSLQCEGLLSQHYEEFPPAGERDYQFLGGELPVLVLAPHATAYFHEGEFQEADAFTGAMAALLNRTARCHTLLSSYCCVADPCWHLETPMRRAFADIVKTGEMGLVVFLLGSSWHESPGLHVGSAGAEAGSAGDDLAGRLRLAMSMLEPVATDIYDHRVHPLMRFTQEELGVPVVAVRMHKRYRMPRLQPDLYAATVGILSEFVSQVGADLLRSRS